MIYFQPNCTIPPEPPAFVTAPNVRSTMNIVWGCISTILLCCWSIQHLNVPPQFQPKTIRQKLMRKLFFLWRKVKWMMITLFAPECILAKAVTDLRSCLLHSPMLQELADEDGVPWSKSHTFLADMGGFALRFTPSSHPLECQPPSAPPIDEDAEPRPSPQENSSNTTGDGQRHIDATEEEQDQMCGHGSGGSLPTQSPPNSPQNQARLASIEACDSPYITNKKKLLSDERATSGQDTVTQRELVDEASPGIEISRLLSTTEEHIRQTLTSKEAARQQLQRETPSNATVESGHERRALRNHRRRFRARVDNASQSFGDIMWRAFKHNEIISTKIYLESSAHFQGGDGWNAVSTLLKFEGDVWVLTAAQLIESRRQKLIVRLPHLTEDEVSDRNKGDLLVKLLALLQVSWMVIQIIARATLHISSTPLEAMTLSFAACTFITYILLLNHPQDVTASIYIEASRLSTVDDMRKIAELSSPHGWFEGGRLPCTSNNAIHWNKREGMATSHNYLAISLGAGAAVFGGAHLVAWNFVFPTVVERILWRTSSLVTLLGPSVTILVTSQANILTQRIRGRPLRYNRDRLLQALTGLSMLALMLARLFVIVEAFRSLYYLPQDAYFTTWASNAPFIA